MSNNNLKSLAKCSIEIFFEDKKFFCKESITKKHLLSEENINIVLNTPHTDEVFEFIHEKCLGKMTRPKDFHHKSPLHWTIDFLLYLIRDMNKKWLPKDFQPGLLLLYFKLCKNIDILEIL